MLAAGANLSPAIVRGIEPEEEKEVSDIERYLVSGGVTDLVPGAHKIILGRVLALHLGLSPGDPVTLLVPRIVDGRVAPRYAAFTVAGIFEAGIQDNDASIAFVNLKDASELKGSARRRRRHRGAARRSPRGRAVPRELRRARSGRSCAIRTGRRITGISSTRSTSRR